MITESLFYLNQSKMVSILLCPKAKEDEVILNVV
jgi:hypothetical protein